MKIHSAKRTAVSPILATLMMIAVGVAMSVIIFVWSQGFLSQTSSAAGGQQAIQNQAAQSSVAIELATFSPCVTTCTISTTPKVTMVIRNVGAVSLTLGSLTMQGLSSNTGFTGSYTITSIPSVATALTSTDAACTGPNAPTIIATSTTLAKGASATITLAASATACTTSGRIFSGDVVSIKITTAVGTFASAQFTVP